MNRRIAVWVLVALFVGAAGLIVLEFANGAADAGALAIRDPCEPRSAFPGEGIDATLQRIVSDGLDGAACELGTTREELVLSLAPGSGVEPILWDDETCSRTHGVRSAKEPTRRSERSRSRRPARVNAYCMSVSTFIFTTP